MAQRKAEASAPASLVDFAKENPARRTSCWVCDLPEEVLAQVEQGAKVGIAKTVTVKWLRSLGHTAATENKLYNHLANHVK